MKNTFDKRVRPRVFNEGDLVLKKRLPNVKDLRGKWAPNYKGPYVVKQAFSRGALVLADPEGQELIHPTWSKCSILKGSIKKESEESTSKSPGWRSQCRLMPRKACIRPSQNLKTSLPWVKPSRPKLKMGPPRRELQPSSKATANQKGMRPTRQSMYT
ncbi:hypothetical protein CR513_29117, partial [Mucuna pruriens]